MGTPPHAMHGRLTLQQAIMDARAAGFTGVRLLYIVSIAMAETGGSLNTDATSPNPDGGTNYGVLQIDGKAHPQFPAEMLFDPNGAFVAAYQISKGGTDFSAWQTYHGSQGHPAKYIQYVGQVWEAAMGMGGWYKAQAQQLANNKAHFPIAGAFPGSYSPNDTATPDPGLPNPVPDIAGLISGVVARVGWILLGAVLLIAGVFILVNPAGDIGPAIQAASQSKEPIPDA